jgi:hypothetical protein
MGKKKNMIPPGIYASKPYPSLEGSQYEEDGMEHLDQEVFTMYSGLLWELLRSS